MNWISNLMITVILTCVTGSVLTIIWALFCSILKFKVNVRIIYGILKCVMTGYLIPLIFLLLKWQTIHMDGSAGYLLITTQGIEKCLVILFIIWGSGVIVLVARSIPQLAQMKRIFHTRMKVSKEQEKILRLLCKELRIHRKIRLCRSYSAGTPFVIGIVRSSIYLPVENYSLEELEIILTHELCHCKQGDVFWKPVFSFICYVYWFNPLVWYVWNQMKRLAEVSCDSFCCRQKYSSKRYFDLLMNMNERAVKHILNFAPMWFEDEYELKWRVMFMKKSTKKDLKRWGVTLVIVVAVLCGSISSYAANVGAEKIYGNLYKETVVSTQEMLQPDNPEKEYTGTLDDFEGMEVIEEEDTLGKTKEAKNIDWTIKDGSICKSTEFYKSKGSEISVAVFIEPSDKYVKVGIIQPDTTIRYVYSKGSISHTFEVKQSGNHRVFISNDSGTKVVAAGAYTR